MASLGVSVVITLGCGQSPPWEPPAPTKLWNPVQRAFSVHGISPTFGPVTPSAGATVARIAGTGFQSGAIVTVDGSRVDATVLSLFAISLAMPAHAAGTANVTVINPLSQAQASVPGGYTYIGPPVISELLPNIGSTAGGTRMVITGPSLCCMEVTVTVDGIVVRDIESGWPANELYLSTPAHAAGTVNVIVTDGYGQTGSREFTYASPATFDFNGDWEGWAQDLAAPRGSAQEYARFVLTIRDNNVLNVSCGTAPSLTLAPPPVVANGEFSFADSGGGSITGNILSPRSASGSIDMASCGSRRWTAERKQ
jgi:hypothetical protein